LILVRFPHGLSQEKSSLLHFAAEAAYKGNFFLYIFVHFCDTSRIPQATRHFGWKRKLFDNICTKPIFVEMKTSKILQMLSMVGIVYSFHYPALDHLHTLHDKRKRPPEEVNHSRRQRRRRNRSYAITEINLMDDQDFVRHFKLSRSLFEYLLAKILPFIQISEKGQQNSINSSGSIITPQIKLAIESISCWWDVLKQFIR
jgi:hypothetical protein